MPRLQTTLNAPIARLTQKRGSSRSRNSATFAQFERAKRIFRPSARRVLSKQWPNYGVGGHSSAGPKAHTCGRLRGRRHSSMAGLAAILQAGGLRRAACDERLATMSARWFPILLTRASGQKRQQLRVPSKTSNCCFVCPRSGSRRKLAISLSVALSLPCTSHASEWTDNTTI